MKLELELKPSDIILLKLLACVLIIFFSFRFFIFPGIEKHQDLISQKDTLTFQKEEMQQTISTRATTEKLIEKQKENLAESAEGFYEEMENQQLDELITGLALQHNLFPVSLNISQPVVGIPRAYQSGITSSNSTNTESLENTDNIKNTDNSESSESSDFSDLTANSNNYVPYLSTVTVSVTLQGTEEQIRELIDDVAKNYPGIQIQTMDMQKATYVNASLQTVEQMNCSCDFAVYMYQKEDTSEGGNGSEK